MTGASGSGVTARRPCGVKVGARRVSGVAIPGTTATPGAVRQGRERETRLAGAATSDGAERWHHAPGFAAFHEAGERTPEAPPALGQPRRRLGAKADPQAGRGRLDGRVQRSG